MTVNATELKVGTKIHTHIRTELKYMNGRPIDTSKKATSLTPVAAVNEFKQDFEFKRYAETYSRDQDGNTEYIIFTATTKDDFRLTIHSFSCYCEPLNENQAPPF